MKYALLIYTTPGMVDHFSNGELEAITSEYYAPRDQRGASPAAISRTWPPPPRCGRHGRTLTTHGPFAETKEVFAGYYVFELDNLDAAIEIAARVPAAPGWAARSRCARWLGG